MKMRQEKCECCGAVATGTDDGGCQVCDDCRDGYTDDDGTFHCACEGDGEYVRESCGAGGQTRTYYRATPPDMPDENPHGEWACYWATAGDDGHVVSRHSTREDAEQAVASHDWPPPGDHTAYLCGYEVYRLVEGEWSMPEPE